MPRGQLFFSCCFGRPDNLKQQPDAGAASREDYKKFFCGNDLIRHSLLPRPTQPDSLELPPRLVVQRANGYGGGARRSQCLLRVEVIQDENKAVDGRPTVLILPTKRSRDIYDVRAVCTPCTATGQPVTVTTTFSFAREYCWPPGRFSLMNRGGQWKCRGRPFHPPKEITNGKRYMAGGHAGP